MCELLLPRKVFLTLLRFYLEFWLHFAQTMLNAFFSRTQKYIITVTDLPTNALNFSLTLFDTQRALFIPLVFSFLVTILIPCYQLSSIHLLHMAGR